MKILLFSNRKKRYIPPKIKKVMQEDGHGNPYSVEARTKRVVSYIKDNATVFDSVVQDNALEELASSEDAIIKYKESPLKYFVKKGSEIFCMSLVDVDITRPWMIKLTASSNEYIEYLD